MEKKFFQQIFSGMLVHVVHSPIVNILKIKYLIYGLIWTDYGLKGLYGLQNHTSVTEKNFFYANRA
jgi:hypothetical protein